MRHNSNNECVTIHVLASQPEHSGLEFPETNWIAATYSSRNVILNVFFVHNRYLCVHALQGIASREQMTCYEITVHINIVQ